VGLALGRVGCFLNGCCYGEVCQAEGIPAVSYPYGSNAYIDHYREGRLPQPPPAALLGEEPGTLLSRRVVEADPDLAQIAAAHRSAPTHPSQLYSTLTALLVAGICVAYLSLSPVPGRVFALMLILEGMTRFILEMLRVEPAVIGRGTDTLASLPPMSYSMVLGALIFVAGLLMWSGLGLAGRRRGNPASVPAGA
jgi:phosphatidylglycerol:prolipoprotein diacylglycerol transferase